MEVIRVDFDATGQLLIIYFAFVKYLRKNGNTAKQCIIISNLSNDRSKASSKTIPPHSAI